MIQAEPPFLVLFQQDGKKKHLTLFEYCLHRRHSKSSVKSVCELVHNIVFESRRVARTYDGVFNWLVSYAVCDLSDLN